jgi:hypothetical protein
MHRRAILNASKYDPIFLLQLRMRRNYYGLAGQEYLRGLTSSGKSGAADRVYTFLGGVMRAVHARTIEG